MSQSLDGSIPRLPALPPVARELRPHPHGDHSRGRGHFVLAPEEDEEAEALVPEAVSHSSDLPVTPHEADEAGGQLDVTA